jgi:hypothetical protein
MWARLCRGAALAFGLLTVAASAQLSEGERLDRCASNRQAVAALEAQRDHPGAMDTSMARAELGRMKAHFTRLRQIEALRATGGLLGGWQPSEVDRQLELETDAIVTSARKYNVCESYIGAYPVEGCITQFEQMIAAAAAAPPPDPQVVQRQLAVYRNNLVALGCAGADQAAAAAGSGPGCHGFTGKWDTNYGPMWLVQNGSSITGFYDWVGSAGPRHDTLSGNVAGNVAEGTYSQPGYPNPDYQSGRFRFVLRGNGFTGEGWKRGGGGAMGWGGTCASH